VRHALILLVALSISIVPPAKAQWIGLYTEPDPVLPVPSEPPSPPRTMSLPVGVPTAVYIVAHVSGSALLQDGLSAAEFALAGLPMLTDLIATDVTANPFAVVSYGDPFSTGAQIDFHTCMAPSDNQALLLYSAQLVALNPVSDVRVTLTHHQFPSDTQFVFPWLRDCDTLDFPLIAASSSPLIINPAVAVQSRTWSGVKRLYE
jgi:hypothetical protein